MAQKVSTGALVRAALIKWIENEWFEFIQQTQSTTQPREQRLRLTRVQRLLYSHRFNTVDDAVAFMLENASSLFDSKEACEAFVRVEAEKAINANKTNGTTH